MGKQRQQMQKRIRSPRVRRLNRLCTLFDYDNATAQAEFVQHGLSHPMLAQLQRMWERFHFLGVVEFPAAHMVADLRSTGALIQRDLVEENNTGVYSLSAAGVQAADRLFFYWWEDQSGQRRTEPQHFTGDTAKDERQRWPA